jgi:hypothetical protein
MKSTDSQTAIIKGWLLNGHSLTTLEALTMFRCFRLAARVANLRSEGLPILTEMVDINGKRVARYSIIMDFDIIEKR